MERRHLVEALVAWGDDPRQLIARLQEYPYDITEPLATLRKADITAALRRFLTGEVSAASVEAWADAVESRDDIAYSRDDSAAIANALFILSNPGLNGVLTFDRAKRLLEQLGHADSGR